MNVNVGKMEAFLKKKVNDKVARATGINVMQLQHKAEQMGLAPSKPPAGSAAAGTGHAGTVVHIGGGGGVQVVQGKAGPHVEPARDEEYPMELIKTVEDFLSQRDTFALTPYGGTVLFMHALLNYAQPATRHLGEQLLVLSMWEENLVEGSTYKRFALNQQDQQRLAVVVAPPNDCTPRSYVHGAKAEHGYWFDPAQVALRFQAGPDLPATATEATVMVWSSGADTPRPITLRKNKKNFWKVVDFAGLLAPVKSAQAPVHTAADEL